MNRKGEASKPEPTVQTDICTRMYSGKTICQTKAETNPKMTPNTLGSCL